MTPKNAYKITEELLFPDKEVINPFIGKRYRLIIVKRFEFSSKYQSMSVIIKNCLDDSYRFFLKGAPEKIIQFCNNETIPSTFDEMLMEHTKNGFRVLACATKPLASRDNFYHLEDDRRKYECDLNFLGFIIFKNKLKRDTKHVISNLKHSDCKLVMATGDNPFTSLSVARECELIDNDKSVFIFDLEKDHESENEKFKMYYFI
jgi:cation-transporting ATPase 13A3/4/5